MSIALYPKAIVFASRIRERQPRTFWGGKWRCDRTSTVSQNDLDPLRKYDLKPLENILANPHETLDRIDQLLTVVSDAVLENDLDIFNVGDVL